MESPSFSITNSTGDQDAEEYDFESDAKTDAEVSRYSFFDRLEHYMEHMQICMENLKAVELTLMVKAGSNVREMATMNKESRELAFHHEYLTLIGEIADERFTNDGVRQQMQTVFKGARKKDMNPGTLYRKYESEMTTLKKFAYKFPGVGSLSQLPSGTAQLQQMKRPLIIELWKKKYPVRRVSFCVKIFTEPSLSTFVLFRMKKEWIMTIRLWWVTLSRILGGWKVTAVSIFFLV
jgi:hypothetical protein